MMGLSIQTNQPLVKPQTDSPVLSSSISEPTVEAFRGLTKDAFKKFMGAEYKEAPQEEKKASQVDEEGSSDIDKYVFDVFLRLEEDSSKLEKFQKRLDLAPTEMRDQLLLAAKSMAERLVKRDNTQENQDKLTYIQNQLKDSKAVLAEKPMEYVLQYVQAADYGFFLNKLDELYADEKVTDEGQEQDGGWLSRIFTLDNLVRALLLTTTVITVYKMGEAAVSFMSTDNPPEELPPIVTRFPAEKGICELVTGATFSETGDGFSCTLQTASIEQLYADSAMTGGLQALNSTATAPVGYTEFFQGGAHMAEQAVPCLNIFEPKTVRFDWNQVSGEATQLVQCPVYTGTNDSSSNCGVHNSSRYAANSECWVPVPSSAAENTQELAFFPEVKELCAFGRDSTYTETEEGYHCSIGLGEKAGWNSDIAKRATVLRDGLLKQGKPSRFFAAWFSNAIDERSYNPLQILGDDCSFGETNQLTNYQWNAITKEMSVWKTCGSDGPSIVFADRAVVKG